MSKWLISSALLLLFAGGWLVSEAWPDRRPHPDAPAALAAATSAPAPAPTPTATASATRAPVATAAATSAPSATPKLDVRSDELRKRLDEQIPRRLYAEAARCYQGGLDKDQRLDLTYRLHVAGGEVSVSDLRTVENTLADSGLERCIRGRLQAARWRDDALPDLDEDDDLYMHVGGFARYVASAER